MEDLVPGLTGMELILFLAACTELSLRFVTRPVFLTHQCFSYCGTVLAQCQHLLCVLLWPTVSRLGWAGGWEGAQPGQLTPAGQRDIPYYMTSCSAIKSEGRRRKRGCSELRHFVFQSNRCVWWSPAVLEMAEQLPANGKWWVNSLFCFASVHSFCFSY